MTQPQSRRVELLLLLVFIVFLPLFEAPKNLFWLGYVVVWIINRVRAREFGGHWDYWDTAVCAVALSSALSAIFGGIHKDEWQGVVDVVRYVVLFALVRRSRYTYRELIAIGATLAFSTLIALSYAYWSYYVTHTRPAIELNSVGHVNHSSIYLVVAYGAALSAVIAYWARASALLRTGGLLLVLLFGMSVILNDSRAAIAALLLSSLILGFAWLRRSGKPLIVIALVVAITSVSAVAFDFSVVKKHERNVEMNLPLAYRDLIWNGALEMARRFPMFGVGMNNFAHVGNDELREYVTARGATFDPDRYYPISHAHSLYLNTLAERGLLGVAALLAVLFAWCYSLVKFAPRPADSELAWALWGGALMTLVLNCGVGLFNTTLHHEHALLSLLLLGMWLGHVRLPAPAPVPASTVRSGRRAAPRRQRPAAARRASRIS